MDPTDVRNFAIALGIGALIGMEREKRKSAEPYQALGGIRTFILLAMAGAISAWISVELQATWIFALALVAAAALVLTGYGLTLRAGTATAGLTTEVAALVTVLLGGLVMFGWPALAVGLGITTAAVLAFKVQLHGAVARIGEDDIYAGIKLLIATFIVLPLLPDRPLDPLEILNPHQLWLLVILIAGLSLLGYVAVRLLGQTRGTAVTGIFGGMVSSTAVTLSFSRRSRDQGGRLPGDALAAGILLAWMVMFLRVFVEVFVVHRPLLLKLALPLGVMAGTSAAAGLVLFRRGVDHATPEADEVPLRNPFSLTAAAKFAAVFAVIMLAVGLAERLLPPRGMYVVAALAGLTDMDAITLSMAEFARTNGETGVAALAITIAALSNTLVKGGMVLALGSGSLKRRVGIGMALVVAAGLGALLLV
ncbi:MAG TPA: DUF4010 domain-containing protein [Gemmatimonadales bacterium]